MRGWRRTPEADPVLLEKIMSRPSDPHEQEWVDKITSYGYPVHIANAMNYYIQQNKVHVAAHLALEFIKMEEAAGRWPPKPKEEP